MDRRRVADTEQVDWRPTGVPRRCLSFGAVVAIVLIAGCGGAPRQTGAGTQVGVTERDFKITTSLARVAPGQVTLSIHNAGPDQHELIVAPAGSRALPFRSDGFTISEETIQRSEPGSVNPQEPGRTTDLKLNLSRGRYVLFCNMEGHFMAGMHTVLVVG